MVSQFAASLLGVGAVLLGLGLAGVFGAQLLASLWLAVTLRRRDRRDRPAGGSAPTPLAVAPLARLWGLFVLSVGLAEIVEKRVELVFLDAFGSSHDVAVYAVAFSLVTVAVVVPGAIASATVPGIAAAAASSTDALSAHLQRAARVALLAGCLLTAGLAAVGPSAVVAFWGGGLADARTVVPWIALSALFVPLPVLCGAYWTGMGRLTPVLVATAIGAVVDLTVAAALVPALGVTGAVAANVSAQVVTCVVLVGYTRRRVAPLGVSLPYAARFVGAAVLGGGAAWAVARGLDGVSPLLGLVAGIAVFAAVVGLAGVLAGLLPGEDADWLAETAPAVARPALVAVGGLRWARAHAVEAALPRDGVPATGTRS
jgi:O-antigen/teichoic acid export membrane protein